LGVSEDKAFLIPNSVSDDRIGVFSDGTPRSERKTIELVSVGRLEWQKGYDRLIQSLPRVLQNFPDIRLTIFGEGRERTPLQSEIDRLRLGHVVTLPGYISDPITALRQADLFVLCSRFEGMSNAMLEALYCGIPVMATDNAENSANEVIIDGRNGFLVRGSSIESIEQGLLRAVRQFRSLDRDWIRHDAKRRFSFESYLRHYSKLLERIAKGVAA
jgi:glycosyltransferase involved in cell wall biosynthesis